MKFNQNTLRTISQGDFIPDQEYVIEMAKALMQKVFIQPRLDGDKRPDGSPQWYDIFKEGVKRGEIYHASTINSFSIEIDGNDKDWISCRTLQECEIKLAEIIK